MPAISKKTVVIATLNAKYIHASLAPWCLLAGLRQYGDADISAAVEEGTINEPAERLASRIAQHKPDIVGLCCYIWNIRSTYALIAALKEKRPDCVIVLGGPEVSYCTDEVLGRHPEVDFVLSGEGEKPFALLCSALFAGRSISEIPGLSFRQDGTIIQGEPYIAAEQPPSPYTEAYFAALNGRIAYLETTRGCPYACAFCLSGRCGKVRFFDEKRAETELLKLAQSGAKTVKFVDRTFNANEKRAARLVTFIIKHYGKEIPKGVCFHFEIAGDILSEGFMDLLGSAPKGAIQLEIGMQSFNEKTLNYIHRKTDTDRLCRNIRRLLSYGNMHIHIDLIAGLPFEDLSSFEKSFDRGYKLGSHMLQLGFLKLLHGSGMREDPDRYPCEFDENPPYEVKSTPWLSRTDISRLKRVEDALERLSNSGRFPHTLRLLEEQYTPFALFEKAGGIAAAHLPLDEYINALYDLFSAQTDKTALREAMVKDRLSSNATGILPGRLQIPEPELRRYKMALQRLDPAPAGVRRGMAVLYSSRQLVYADYGLADPVSGRYPLKFIKIEDLKK